MLSVLISRSAAIPEFKSKGYSEVKRLGKGAFGYAILVRREDELLVAKLIRYSHMSKANKEYIHREVQAMKTISENGGHPFHVRFRQSFKTGMWLAIVMDYCDSGDLQARIKGQREANEPFKEGLVQSWLAKLLTAVDFLHKSKILHRDIKPANIFMHHHDEIKLGDLGLSKCGQAVTVEQEHTQCGSPMYLAPEVHMGATYSKSVDIWAIGCTLFEMMMLKPAFQGKNVEDTLRNIVNARYGDITGCWDNGMVYSLEKMLELNSKDRPGTMQLFGFPYFRRLVCSRELPAEAFKHRPGFFQHLIDSSGAPINNSYYDDDLLSDEIIHDSMLTHYSSAHIVDAM